MGSLRMGGCLVYLSAVGFCPEGAEGEYDVWFKLQLNGGRVAALVFSRAVEDFRKMHRYPR